MHTAIVLLSEPQIPDAQAVLAALASIAPAVASGVTALPAKESARLSAVSLGGLGEVFIALVDGPVPDREAELNAPYSASSFSTGWRPGAHQAHAVIAYKEAGELPALERLRLFTFVLAAVVESSHCVGVYWGATHATHEPRFFVNVARQSEMLPLLLWTGVCVAEAVPGRCSLMSLAMNHLELPNLLVSAPLDSAQDPLDLLFSLLHFATLRGAAPGPGELVGRNSSEQVPVTYVPSPLRPDEQVWSVVFP